MREVSVFRFAGCEFVAQIIDVAAEESFFLDEVDEHQSVQHYRGIPALKLIVGNAVDELQKRGVFFLEAFIETLRDLLDIESRAGANRNIDKREVFFLGQLERNTLELLD